MRCFAILMAAGFSRRFGGSDKLLTPFRGKPLACHTLDLVCGMGCFERVFWIYAGTDVAALADDAAAAGLPVTALYNPAPEKGQQESAIAGVRAADAFLTGENVRAEPAYYVFFPCDQPLLDAETVYRLLDAARPGRITEPARGRSPTVFSTFFRDELLALKPGESPRLLKTRHPDLLITVAVPRSVVLEDVDTPADLARLENDACYSNDN